MTGEPLYPQRAESLYVAIESDELIGRFYETEGDPDIGRELSIRLFEHAEFPDDPETTPLIGRDGEQVQEDGQSLMQAEYVNFAARHHFEALETILDFLMMEKGSPDYGTMRAAMLARLGVART